LNIFSYTVMPRSILKKKLFASLHAKVLSLSHFK
jgi:hypothetical protein